jgi:hypothetical protein
MDDVEELVQNQAQSNSGSSHPSCTLKTLGEDEIT